MARQKRGPYRTKRQPTAGEGPIDVATIGQGVGNFETINGMPQGIVAAGLVVLAVVLIRPITRALRAFLRG